MRFSVLTLFFCHFIFAQTQYPKDYFSPPLDIPMQLSGNFGELRPNHFHAGFDLKTNQREGLNVYAVADGYVSRIKISTFGNGKCIYITHPNGYTSVYGHLQTTIGAIQDYVQKTHYKEKAFEIEIFLKPDELPVTKGQLIALSGNTGSSEGPHLHFEIRDSKTEFVINPMFFGFDKNIKDTKKPTISNVFVYPFDNTTVNQSKLPLLLNLSLQKDGTYLASKVKANGKIGFGINAVDFDDVSGNKNGVFNVSTFFNGNQNYNYQFNTYSFDEMRYINAFIDYPRYKKTSQRVQKLFMKTPFALSIIKTDSLRGIIKVEPNLASTYRIEVSDYFGNMNTVTVPIEYDIETPIVNAEPNTSKYFIHANKDSNFEKDNMSVFFPAGTFYDDFDMNFDVKNNRIYIHEDVIPVHSNFTITIKDSTYSEALRDKLFIARISGNSKSYNGTIRNKDVFTAKSKILGQFGLVLDTIAPVIKITKPIEGKWISEVNAIQFTIGDSLSGIKSYNGYLNGNWVLFEYDNKTRKITHKFQNELLAEGANDLKVEVVDNVGNSTIFETHFFRSQLK
ncbi:M23 family metallopeptidase [Flavobacterium sp. ANB]|uniref:M23 family metallopeptidase n=1 Tax=unclassified Flavobacterium TaxID=196869 RepID=UPI0012B9F4E9|nr:MULTISPECIES: M23 family metallopeptidase [unclassified Flavobacterium]MBF4518852.1 M23 family metallopeptidase [Flavobacterium sp. ANB]MTD71435.1 peptidoglycan DD-metalloendopeptidase family protein [Flavobacterium sp. LC2016-13]